MNFLMISKCGEGAGLLHRIQLEGNDCRLYIQQAEDRQNWGGLLTQVNQPIPHEDEIIIFDQSGMGQLANHLSKHNPVFGGSLFADKLEDDRAFGLHVMKSCGIKVPETHNFNSSTSAWSAALEFTRNLRPTERYVFKPSGDGLPSKLSYVASDRDDLLSYLRFIYKSYAHEIKEFVLQKFVKGTIVSTELWCDGTQFVYPGTHTCETKKLMNDDLGPSTGCSGNVLWPEFEECWIVEDGVGAAEGICVHAGYKGPIDLNAIITESGDLYGLEWTPRFGYDAMPTLLQVLSTDVGQLISDFARGQAPDEFPIQEKFAAGVRLSIPPYPLEPPHTKDVRKVGPNEGIPIRGLESRYSENVYFYEVKLNDDNHELVHALGAGAVLVASDSGDSVEEALEVPYKILESVKIPDKQYRTDLKEVLNRMVGEVQEMEEVSTNAH